MVSIFFYLFLFLYLLPNFFAASHIERQDIFSLPFILSPDSFLALYNDHKTGRGSKILILLHVYHCHETFVGGWRTYGWKLCCIWICCGYLLHGIIVVIGNWYSPYFFYIFPDLEICLTTKTKYFHFKWIESTFLYLSGLISFT